MVKFHEYGDTPRKRAAYARRLRLDREKLPLFSPLIQEEQDAGPSVDQVMADRAISWEARHAAERVLRARKWREGRARLFSYGANARRILRDAWDVAPYPAGPYNFLGFLHSYDVGRLNPELPPWALRPCVPGTVPQQGSIRDGVFTLLRRLRAHLDPRDYEYRAERAPAIERRLRRLADRFRIELGSDLHAIDDRGLQ